MSGQLQFGINKLLRFTVILTVSLFLTVLLYTSGFLGYADKVLYDLCVNHRVLKSPQKKNSLVASIDLNDASIKSLGDALDTRQAFTDILEILAESNTSAVMDFLFNVEKNNDTAFTNSVKYAQNTVIAALAVDKNTMNQTNSPYLELTAEERQLLKKHIWQIKVLDKGKVPQAGTFLLPFPALLNASGQIAHINMDPDTDGIYRRTPLLYEWEGGYIPSLGLAAAVSYLGVKTETIELKAGSYLSLPLSENEIIRIPIDIQGRILIPYTETWQDDTGRISFSTVVKAKTDDEVFDKIYSGLNGHIAILSEISTSQKDFGPTPFERLYPLSGVHSEVLSGILSGLEKRTFISWASILFKAITILLLLCVSFLFFHFNKDLLFHLGFLASLIIFSYVTIYRWNKSAITPWVSLPVFLFFLLWLCSFLYRLFARYRTQLLLSNALSRYFPHALAQRIMREGKTDLKPAYKELTILFSDISGFTKWSSDKPPEAVHNFLSDYLESMAEILFTHGGTVDKFMGDGILAFFGDPLEMPDHTERCIKAAIAMQKKVRLLAEKWKPIVDIDLKVRIGINTGKVIVGNLGNKTRIEYTVIGASVNLAQRMESNAPIGGILVTADVREKVKDKFSFPERKDVTVKGYAETIEAYAVGEAL